MTECQSYNETDGVRTGCDLQLNGTHIFISFRERRNHSSFNTFRKAVTSNGIMVQYVLSLSTINCRKNVFEKLVKLHDYGTQIAGRAFNILALAASCETHLYLSALVAANTIKSDNLQITTKGWKLKAVLVKHCGSSRIRIFFFIYTIQLVCFPV